MIIDFKNISEEAKTRFKGGEGMMHSRALIIGDNNFMLNRLESRAMAGQHTHNDNCEIIYVLRGALDFEYDGTTEHCHAGQLHYCPEGHTHAFRNNGEDDAVFLALVIRQ